MPWRESDRRRAGDASERLADLYRLKAIRGHAALSQRVRQLADRLVDTLRRQLKGPEVHRDAPGGTEIEVCLHRLRRIHMDVLHEPARLVGADGQEREVYRRQAGPDLAEVGAVAGVAGVEDAPAADLDQESSPERAVTVERGAGGEVLGRGDGDGAVGLPPVQLDDARGAGRAKQPGVAERCDELGMEALLEPAERPQIAVIVVVVGLEHGRDGRQVLEADSGRADADGSHEGERARAPSVDRINEDRVRRGLDQKGGVADEGDDDFARCRDGRLPRLDRDVGRPAREPSDQHARHFPERLAVGAAGIEEAAAVEVIARAASGPLGHTNCEAMERREWMPSLVKMFST